MKQFLLATVIPLILSAAPASAAQQVSPAAPANQRDADAMAALEAMGAALRARTSFNVRADITSEDVLDSGQKIQRGGTVDMVVRRPDRFRVSIRDGRRDRDLYYDGRSFTVFAPTLGYYSSFAAPPTIAATLKQANDVYGIEVPLADLFSWGVDADLVGRVRSAFHAGYDIVNGHNCARYAIRQDLVDWQVWIRDGAVALPCKLVITSKMDPTMPQFTAVYDWRDTASPQMSKFNFQPPKGASKISFKQAGGGNSSQDH